MGRQTQAALAVPNGGSVLYSLDGSSLRPACCRLGSQPPSPAASSASPACRTTCQGAVEDQPVAYEHHKGLLQLAEACSGMRKRRRAPASSGATCKPAAPAVEPGRRVTRQASKKQKTAAADPGWVDVVAVPQCPPRLPVAGPADEGVSPATPNCQWRAQRLAAAGSMWQLAATSAFQQGSSSIHTPAALKPASTPSVSANASHWQPSSAADAGLLSVAAARLCPNYLPLLASIQLAAAIIEVQARWKAQLASQCQQPTKSRSVLEEGLHAILFDMPLHDAQQLLEARSFLSQF